MHLPLTGILFFVASPLGEDVLFKMPLPLFHPTVPQIVWFMFDVFRFSLLAKLLGKWHKLARLQSRPGCTKVCHFHAHSLEECL